MCMYKHLKSCQIFIHSSASMAVSIFIYSYIRIYIHIFVSIFIYSYLPHINMNLYTSENLYIRIHTIHTRMYACVYTHIRMYACVYTHIYACTHVSLTDHKQGHTQHCLYYLSLLPVFTTCLYYLSVLPVSYRSQTRTYAASKKRPAPALLHRIPPCPQDIAGPPVCV